MCIHCAHYTHHIRTNNMQIVNTHTSNAHTSRTCVHTHTHSHCTVYYWGGQRHYSLFQPLLLPISNTPQCICTHSHYATTGTANDSHCFYHFNSNTPQCTHMNTGLSYLNTSSPKSPGLQSSSALETLPIPCCLQPPIMSCEQPQLTPVQGIPHGYKYLHSLTAMPNPLIPLPTLH